MWEYKTCGILGSYATAVPRIESRKCAPVKLREKKDRFAHQLKVANRSFVVAESSPARAGAQRSEREKGGDYAPGDSKGRSPWRAFGDFPRDGKVTRVPSMALPCSRGAPASGGAGASSSAKSGARGERPLSEGVGAMLPLGGAGAKSDDLLPRGALPLAKKQKQREAGKESLSRLPVPRIFPYLMEFS